MEIREARDLIISALVIAFAFSYQGINNINIIPINFAIAIFAVALGFILHELSHRFIAKKHKCHAEYRMWKEGLLLALALAILTNGAFTFAAPGAVMIAPLVTLWGDQEKITRKDIGLISISGPIMNLLLAGAFIALDLLIPSLSFVFSLGARVNIWLGFFNMLPIPPLDGSKVLLWSKKIWAVMLVAFLILLIFY
jgi:Zn-dependent protease